MSWLIGPTIASAMVAFLVVRIFSYVFGEATSGVASFFRLASLSSRGRRSPR